MPRNDEVFIPGKSQAQFESIVRQLGGTIGRTAYTRGEIVELFTEKWQQELARRRNIPASVISQRINTCRNAIIIAGKQFWGS